jgi:hypothetical protein
VELLILQVEFVSHSEGVIGWFLARYIVSAAGNWKRRQRKDCFGIKPLAMTSMPIYSSLRGVSDQAILAEKNGAFLVLTAC